MKIDFESRILRRTPNPVALLDTDLHYLYTNEAYQDITGRSVDELLGKSILDILPEETLAIALPWIEKVLQGQEVEYDTPLQFSDGTRKWVFARLIPEFHEDESVAGILVILTDVTRRKYVESRLQRLRALNDDLPTMLAHCDVQERYIYVNRAYASTYGRTPEEVIGMRVQDVMPPALYERINPSIKCLLRGEPTDFDEIIPQTDGRQTWMAVRGIPERSGNDVIGFFVNISDISKHKELEELQSRFASSTVRAQETERRALAQELHDGIAQELAALAILSNMLERKDDSPKMQSVLQMLQEGLQRTVNETRRLSYGLHPLELAERGLINAIKTFLHRSRQVHDGVTIKFDHSIGSFETTLRPEIEIAVYRIIQEAFSNALRHARASRINLLLTLKDSLIVGSINDDGVGFELGPHLAGFGLASMEERATILGGSFEVQSNDAGSSIDFTIPTRTKTER